MNTLLNIPKPKSESFIVWEHLMKSAVAFVGTFAMLFFGPLLFAAKTKNSGSEKGIALDIIDYLFKHPEVKVGICLLAVLIMNIYILIKNRKIKYIVKIETDESIVRTELTNLYYSKKETVEIPLADFEFYIASSTSGDNEKRQRIVFRNSKQVRTIGEINPKHFFWEEHLVQVKNSIKELEEYRKANVTEKSGWFGINTLTGWK